MGTFIIHGGKPLFGSIIVSGSKNAALPVLFATVIARGETEIYNLPDISDVSVTLDILRTLGARISVDGKRTVIDTASLVYKTPDREDVSRIRASSYLIGACLARFGYAELLDFGGCNFSRRPIDLHLAAAEAFGAEMHGTRLESKRLHPAEHVLAKPSVGATVNALLIAAATDGETRLSGYAREPHIQTLIKFLISAGAYITEDENTIVIRGGNLHGGSVRIPGDMIEAGTYLGASIVTHGKIRVGGVSPEELSAFYAPLVLAGAEVDSYAGTVTVMKPPTEAVRVRTAPYPGFPTDLQPILSPVLAVCCGGRIEETVWQDRFGYLTELGKFGISSRRVGNTAEIFPSELGPATASAVDLRGGAACLLAALAADGISRIDNAELCLRGYESPITKLRSLGAEIDYL